MKAKKQSTISRSSTEKYRALAVTTNEIAWIQQLLYDFGITYMPLALLFCDNQATI